MRLKHSINHNNAARMNLCNTYVHSAGRKSSSSTFSFLLLEVQHFASIPKSHSNLFQYNMGQRPPSTHLEGSFGIRYSPHLGNPGFQEGAVTGIKPPPVITEINASLTMDQKKNASITFVFYHSSSHLPFL